MRIKYFCIYWVFIALLAFQSAYGQVEITNKTTSDIFRQPDWRIENLMKQVRELFEAYDKADYAKFVELSHPQIYEKKGLAKFVNELELVISSRLVGYEQLSSTVETPSELFEINKRLFAVVPYKLERVGKVKKDEAVALGSMVGISEDGGKSWRFAKGIAFNEAFPDVASMIPIPNPIEKRFVNGIEQ
jgi:hypothetical protein